MEIQNKKTENFNLFARFIFAGFLIWLCFGCSSRKVQKSETKIVETTKSETVTVDSSKIVAKSDSNIKIIDSSSTDEFTITPLDSTKEMVIDGKKYFNSILKHRKSKNNIITTRQDLIEKITQSAVKETKKTTADKKTEINKKDSDKKQYDWTKTIVVIAILLGIACWLLWFFFIRKNKEKIEQIL